MAFVMIVKKRRINMAYTPKTWVCGEKIKAEDLNHMEQGIADASSGGARFDVNVTLEYQTDHFEVTGFDKTIEEINAAYNSGKVVVAHTNAFGSHQMLNLYGIREQHAQFSACDIMGNQARILYLNINANTDSVFYYKAIS